LPSRQRGRERAGGAQQFATRECGVHHVFISFLS
jgi:hypothetical protein